MNKRKCDPDLETVVEHMLQEAVASGHPPLNGIDAWKDGVRKRVLADERKRPGYIKRAADGLRAAASGRKLTMCTWSRGTHGVSPEYDPTGTDDPPAWWNRDKARVEWERLGKPTWSRAPQQAIEVARAEADDLMKEHE